MDQRFLHLGTSRRLGGSESLSGRYGEVKILVLTGIPTQIPRSSSP
jgi:hypothetical protein